MLSVETTRMESTIETTEAVARYARRVEIALEAGFYDLARRVIDEAEVAATSPPAGVTLDTSLAVVGFPIRIVSALEHAGIHTVRDVLSRTRDQLTEIPSIGDGTVRTIVETLQRLLITAD